MKKKLKVLSLFDGISGARVAIERAGFDIERYYASEIDKYAIQIAQKNYPDTIQVGDITKLKAEDFKGIDLIVGGSPCQDLSIAKKDRQGLAGSRSGLFWEYIRLLKEIKPRYFLLENVASMPKEAKQIITETLGVQPVMINAALVSAQNRKRLFWCNWEVTQPADRGILLKDILENGTSNQKSYCVPATYYKENVKSLVQRKKTGLTVRIGQIGKGGQGDRIYSTDGKSVNLSANGGGRGAKTGLYMVAKNLNSMVSFNNGKESKLDDGTLEGEKKLRTENGDMFGMQTKEKNRYSPQERELARQSDRKPDRNVPKLSLSPSSSYKNMQSEKLRKENEKIRILREAQSEIQKDRKPSNDEVGNNSFVIRKLTCVECERLQTFPDNFTEGVSNSQRYKALGNSFCVEVVRHIFECLKNPPEKETLF